MTTVAEQVGRGLVELGARRLFTLLGSGNYLVTAAARDAGAAVVSTRHETAAVTAADAYARVTGEVGVVTVHQGPGLTNALTGLAEAAKSRTPLLLLAADTAGSAVRSNFRLDAAPLVAAVGAVPERLHGPGTALADLSRAWARARSERRPVVLLMPLDVQAAEALPAVLPGLRDAAPVRPARTAVAALADALAAAQRPVLVAGRGARGCTALLEEVGELTGALLATSAVAGGTFAGSPYDLGISGGFASPTAAELLLDSDLVVAVGASLTMWTTRSGRLLGDDAVVAQVDLDPLAFSERVDLAVVGDARETLQDLLAELAARGVSRPGRRTPGTAARIAAGSWRDVPYDDLSADGRIDPRTLARALDDLLPEERTLVVDSGAFMGWLPMHLRLARDDGFVFTQGFQSVGLGLATAIGTALAKPDRLTVVGLGDGGLLMSLGELETVARLCLPLLVVVFDDSAYGAEVHHFGPTGAPVDLVQFPDADLAAVAAGAGLEAVRVGSADDLGAVTGWLDRGMPGPLLLHARVVPTVVAEWLEEAFRGH